MCLQTPAPSPPLKLLLVDWSSEPIHVQVHVLWFLAQDSRKGATGLEQAPPPPPPTPLSVIRLCVWPLRQGCAHGNHTRHQSGAPRSLQAERAAKRKEELAERRKAEREKRKEKKAAAKEAAAAAPKEEKKVGTGTGTGPHRGRAQQGVLALY